MIKNKNLYLSDEYIEGILHYLNKLIREKPEYGYGGNEELQDNVITAIYRYFQNVDNEFDEYDWAYIDTMMIDINSMSKYKICRDLIFDVSEYGIDLAEFYIEDRSMTAYYMIRLHILKNEETDKWIEYEFRVAELYKDENRDWYLELNGEDADCFVELLRAENEIGYVTN